MKLFKDELRAIKAEYDSGQARIKTEALAAKMKEKPVVLYGAGTLCSFVMGHLSYYDVEVECFCDTFKSGIHMSTGLPIISADQLKKEYPDATVIVTSELHGPSILKTLQEIGYTGTVYNFDDLLGFYTVSYDDFVDCLEGYEWAYNQYSDPVSKQIVLDAMRTRLLGSPMTPSERPQYFEPDICPLSDDEIFVDGGCFIGDTAEEFIRQVKGRYNHIYGFEPDMNNFNKAVANLTPYENIDVFNSGLWQDTNAYKFLSGAHGGSKVSEFGDVISKMVALDDFFKGKQPPTFVKMDVEGSEFHALNGASKLIGEAKPKLAVCVYHKIEDMFDLPQRILQLNPDYKLTLRHYSRWYAESVCYAV